MGLVETEMKEAEFLYQMLSCEIVGTRSGVRNSAGLVLESGMELEVCDVG